MDLLVLGAFAVVLVVLTLWIVWPEAGIVSDVPLVNVPILACRFQPAPVPRESLMLTKNADERLIVLPVSVAR